jgi:hypothetical protein
MIKSLKIALQLICIQLKNTFGRDYYPNNNY